MTFMIDESGPRDVQPNRELIDRQKSQLRKRIESLLDWAKDKPRVEAEVRRILEEMNIPFSRITVQVDNRRRDGKQACQVDIKIPNSWLGNIPLQDESILWFVLPENNESKEHLE